MLKKQLPTMIDPVLSQWQSDYISFENNIWSVNNGELTFEEEKNLIRSPHIKIPRGSYTIHMAYECERKQKLYVGIDSENDSILKANPITLSKNKTFISYDFEVKEDIDNLIITVTYKGSGACKISHVDIISNKTILKRTWFSIFILFLLIDILYIFRKSIYTHRIFILSIFFIVFCTSIPLFTKGMFKGHDGEFHRMRIEGIAAELRYGIFPVRIQPLWMEGYGYPVSIYYGDLLLYIPALLRLVGFSVTTCYKIYITMINFGTTILSFFSFNKVFKNKEISFILSFVYLTASYRIENLYIRSAAGEYTAMMFFPVIAAAIYGIYTEDTQSWKQYRKNMLLLMSGMTGLVCNHILSTEMISITLIIICIIFFRKTLQKNTLRVYLLSAIGTLALSLHFLIPFLDYYLHCNVNINNHVNNVEYIQQRGAHFIQYFSFWQNILGESTIDIKGRFQMTPGIVLTTTLMIAIIICLIRKTNFRIKQLTAFSLFYLFVASNLFPWNFIAQKSFVGNMLAQVQFPWRYIGIAIVFLTLLLGELLKTMPKNFGGISNSVWYMTICFISVITMCSFSSQYCNNLKIVNQYSTAEVSDKFIINGEYLLKGTDSELLSNEIMTTDMNQAEFISRRGTYAEIFCVSGTKEGTVELPLYNYRGYQVSDKKGKTYPIFNGTNNRLAFKVPGGFSGKFIIQFIEPWYWRVALYISILSLFLYIFLIYRIYRPQNDI